MLISPELQATVAKSLESGEKLLWVDSPNAKRMALEPTNIVLCVFGLFWTIHSIIFMLMWNRRPGGPEIDSIFLQGVLILLGIRVLLTPALAYWKGRRTIYALTDRRALIIVQERTTKVESFADINPGQIERTECEDGSGDLILGKKSVKDSEGDIKQVDVKLTGISNVRMVEDLVRSTFKRATIAN